MWRVEDFQARLELPELSGTINLLSPAAGLSQLTVLGSGLAADILQVSRPLDNSEAAQSPVEHYVRGGDLVASYRETGSWPFRAQIYWRTDSHHSPGESPNVLAAVELVASLQTQLLDSQARLCVQSKLRAAEVFRLRDVASARFDRCDPGFIRSVKITQAPACFLLRLDNQVSYGEMVHPLDFKESELVFESTGSARSASLRHDLFAARLEKGVILRARVLGVFLPANGDQAALARQYEKFSDAEPPLTT